MFGSFERRVTVKKRYQIDREDAVRQFRKRGEQSEESLQLHLPLKEVAAALQEGVGHLMRQAGLELMQLVMDEEVRELAAIVRAHRSGFSRTTTILSGRWIRSCRLSASWLPGRPDETRDRPQYCAQTNVKQRVRRPARQPSPATRPRGRRASLVHAFPSRDPRAGA